MKTSKIILGLFILIVLFASSSFAQEITVTTTATNTIASRVTIDLPGLANNPGAIILATPTGNTQTVNQHPIGAWYTNNKWHIFNTDHASLPMGATFKVQVFLKSDADHYLHVVVTANNQTVSRTALNHPGLDFHPEAQVRIFQNHEPYTRNPSEAKVYFDTAARKWFIENVDGTPLKPNTAYNVVITPIPGVGSMLDTTNINTTGKTPISTLPNQSTTSPTGKVGGDLSGTFPNPTVIGLQGKPISGNAPEVGDTLRWNGSTWEPFTPASNATVNANQLVGRDIVTTAPTTGQVLKWGGGSWYPADDNVSASAAPSTAAAKPSVLYFNQTAMVNMPDPNVNLTKPIVGLDNQVFTLTQSSRVVFHTVIDPKTFGLYQGNATAIWLTVEILNSSNAVVARSRAAGWLTFETEQTMNSTGIGLLPPGTYRTRVSIKKQAGGAKLDVSVAMEGFGNQGGQMMIEIFPD